MYNEVNQLYVYIYPLPLGPASPTLAPPPIQPSREAGHGAGGGSWSYWNQQEWKLREGTFSVLWCCSFKRIGQTLIVLFCFHSLSFFLSQDMSLITKFHNTMPVGDNGAPVSGQETRKGGGKMYPLVHFTPGKMYQEDCKWQRFKKETSQICFWIPGLTLCRWGPDSN